MRSSRASDASYTSCSSRTIRASSGAWPQANSTRASVAESRSARTATTAISPTRSRRCRATGSPRCSSGCSPIARSTCCSARALKTSPTASRFDRLVYTGPIDAYFDYCFGALTVPVARIPVRDASDRTLPTRRRRQLSGRRGVHADHGVQASHGPTAPANHDRTRVRARHGRSVLSDPARRKPRAVCEVRRESRSRTARDVRRPACGIPVL